MSAALSVMPRNCGNGLSNCSRVTVAAERVLLAAYGANGFGTVCKSVLPMDRSDEFRLFSGRGIGSFVPLLAVQAASNTRSSRKDCWTLRLHCCAYEFGE